MLGGYMEIMDEPPGEMAFGIRWVNNGLDHVENRLSLFPLNDVGHPSIDLTRMDVCDEVWVVAAI